MNIRNRLVTEPVSRPTRVFTPSPGKNRQVAATREGSSMSQPRQAAIVPIYLLFVGTFCLSGADFRNSLLEPFVSPLTFHRGFINKLVNCENPNCPLLQNVYLPRYYFSSPSLDALSLFPSFAPHSVSAGHCVRFLNFIYLLLQA